MALRIYPEGDYIVFNDVGTTFVQAAHYSNVRWRRNFDGNIEFVNLAENSTVIVAAPVEQIVDATDTPYGATIDDFNSAFSAVLPNTGGGSTSESLLVATFAIRDSVIITEGYANSIDSRFAAFFPNDGRTDKDTFGRTVFVQPQAIFDSKQVLDNRPLDWFNNTVSGTVNFTYNQNRASTNMGVSVGVAGVGVRQTKRRFNYQTGKCSEFLITGKLGAYQAGITKRVGAFDDNNGAFFELSPAGLAGLKVVVRSSVTGSPVDTAVARDDWDNQTIAALLDTTKVQIFWIDFAWLGVGAVRFGVYINAQKYVLHTVRFANVQESVWASVPNFPVRYEIRNDGSGGDSDLEAICSSVQIYGGRQSLGYTFAVSRTAGMTTNNDANFYPVAAIRLKSTASIATIKVDYMSILCTSTSAYIWRLLLNPTIIGTALAWTGIANSAVEANVVSTGATTVTGGTEIASGVGQQGTGINSLEITETTDFALGVDALGVSDILVLAVSRITGTGTNETFHAAINWREEV